VARIRETPWPLWLATIGFLVALFAPVLLEGTAAPARTVVGGFIVVGVILFYVLLASRFAWVIAVVVMAGGVAGVALNGTWWETLIRLFLLGLLLLPVSRAYVWQRQT
jgi:hypothetical protein